MSEHCEKILYIFNKCEECQKKYFIEDEKLLSSKEALN